VCRRAAKATKAAKAVKSHAKRQRRQRRQRRPALQLTARGSNEICRRQNRVQVRRFTATRFQPLTPCVGYTARVCVQYIHTPCVPRAVCTCNPSELRNNKNEKKDSNSKSRAPSPLIGLPKIPGVKQSFHMSRCCMATEAGASSCGDKNLGTLRPHRTGTSAHWLSAAGHIVPPRTFSHLSADRMG
jgi:hypothetical protein